MAIEDTEILQGDPVQAPEGVQKSYHLPLRRGKNRNEKKIFETFNLMRLEILLMSI